MLKYQSSLDSLLEKIYDCGAIGLEIVPGTSELLEETFEFSQKLMESYLRITPWLVELIRYEKLVYRDRDIYSRDDTCAKASFDNFMSSLDIRDSCKTRYELRLKYGVLCE